MYAVFHRALIQYVINISYVYYQLENLEEVFIGFDKDNKGVITKNEFKESIGIFYRRTTPTNLTAYLRPIESDKANEINYKDFISYFSEKIKHQ